MITSDLHLVVLVENGNKQAISVADLVCHICRNTGITSLNLMEHDMIQKNQDGWIVKKNHQHPHPVSLRHI